MTIDAVKEAKKKRETDLKKYKSRENDEIKVLQDKVVSYRKKQATIEEQIEAFNQHIKNIQNAVSIWSTPYSSFTSFKDNFFTPDIQGLYANEISENLNGLHKKMKSMTDYSADLYFYTDAIKQNLENKRDDILSKINSCNNSIECSMGKINEMNKILNSL
ncbi:cytadherence accessory protein [Listeria welshimeri]|uniref:cytadherence accessory protein n=1 Tax=Listeria welshimeri TaxID=1643 RepID=UPI0016249F64|nr:cytadherence accessory protein [Listeria welshimeri]MBC1345162.1 cytadherence accessory protein [Listeria welshimeri]MBC1410717.1 cytadherence accessory protein [Listeria welshimeri]MBC1643160.1 cytadherence accessory protein [Listeria welshimeri]MBC1652759.1 cytadherence accessory protein [Listeria welshimeri]MBC1657427.1 cytadherence accessory protein [Listeria welshimeri]